MSKKRRPSLLGALLWAGLGILLLLHNLDIGFNFWSLAGRYWPLLLILLGLGKLTDYVLKRDAFSVRMGEIIAILLLILIGSTITEISESRFGRFIRKLQIEVGDSSISPGQWIGESHAFTDEATYVLDQPLPILIENSYGLISVAPGSEGQVRVRLKKVVYGNESHARQIASQIRLQANPASRPGSTADATVSEETRQTNWFVIKTNRESLNLHDERFNTDLEVLIPKNSRLEVENSFGEIKVSEINGAIDLRTSYRPLEIRNCTGSFSLYNRYGESRISNLKGNVMLSGRGKVYIENVSGNVHVTNEFSPTEVYDVDGAVTLSATENSIRMERVAGPVTIDARGARLNVSKLKSYLTLTASHQSVEISDVVSNIWINSRYSTLAMTGIRGNIEINSNSDRISAKDVDGSFKLRAGASGLRLDGIRGPLDIETSRKDVIVSNFEDGCRILNEYADVSASALSLSRRSIEIRNRNGSIDLLLPEASFFAIEATARNGQIESDYPGLVPARKEGGDAVLKSQVGEGGARIVLETLNDNIRIRGRRANRSSPGKADKMGKTLADLRLESLYN